MKIIESHAKINTFNQRRKFLQTAGLLPLAFIKPKNDLLLPKEKNDALTAAASKAKIKLSLNAWSYNVELFKYIQGKPGGMSLFDMLEECARLNFDAVDPTGYFFPGYPEAPPSKFINEFKRRAFGLGLDISGTGIRNDFATADKEKRKEGILLAKRWVEVAAEMGAPVLRVFAGAQPVGFSWDEAAGWMSEALAECTDHGKKYGVIIGVQNHGDMLKSADEVLTILKRVQSAWLGVIVDTGFFLTPDPYTDIKEVIPYAVNWQVKELLSDRKGGEIDMERLVALLKASSYRGYVPIETLPVPGKEEQYNALEKVPELLASFKKALGRS